MKTIVIAGGAALALAASAASVQAQGAPGTCYIQVGKLIAPDGVDDLGSAIRQLDVALRPQVEEIKLLESELERLQQRQHEAMQSGEEATDLAALQDETLKVTTDLEAKRSQLKLDYAAQQRVLVGPVQARVSERAQAFANQRGCGNLKMARAGDLAGLQAASARDMTGDFVSWYGRN